jgi:predicted dehydrogenase
LSIGVLCDRRASALEIEAGPDVARTTDHRVALAQPKHDIICVCVNESQHYEVLNDIRRSGTEFKRIVCEKPLTETLEQSREIVRDYSEREICLNFVERYSPVVVDFLRWQRERPTRRIVRAEFFWGKYRVNDHRPTIGDDSEITHPLDLIRVLAKLHHDVPVRILSSSVGYSDFCAHAPQTLDSIDVQLQLGDSLFVTGHSSFVWEERRRRIIVYLRDDTTRETFQAVLNFDDPIWDNDDLVIHSIAPVGGKRTIAFRSQYSAEDFPRGIFKVAKIYRFLRENLATLDEPRIGENLALLSDALWIQRVIHEIRERDAERREFSCRLTGSETPRLPDQLLSAG